jgi:predicted NBD/HSP70 family sugar kinase
MPPQIRVPRAAKGGKPEDVRRHNLGTLLSHLHESGPLSRTDLSGRMGLNRSTIAALVAQLTELGLVEEGLPEGSRPAAGRPSLMVSTRPDQAHVIAVDIGVDRVVVALVGLGGQVLTRRSRRLVTARSPSAVAGLIRRLVDAVLADPSATGRVVGMGVALPGVVRDVDGFVRFAPNLGWVDEPLGDLLRRQLAGPVQPPARVGNDADLGVLAEHLRGAAIGQDDVMFIAGEVGVGGGVIVGGRIVMGAGGYAGELGHLPLVPDGRPCRCGARGCWETEIGAPAVARALGLARGSTEDLTLAVRAAGQAGRAEVLDGVADFIGLGLAGLVNLLNPQLVIMGGLLGEVFGVTEARVRAALDAAALVATAEQVRLARPRLGADAVLIGASELAWEDLLADPVAVLCGPSAPIPAGQEAGQEAGLAPVPGAG